MKQMYVNLCVTDGLDFLCIFSNVEPGDGGDRGRVAKQ